MPKKLTDRQKYAFHTKPITQKAKKTLRPSAKEQDEIDARIFDEDQARLKAEFYARQARAQST